MAKISLKGTDVTTSGNIPKKGEKVPDPSIVNRLILLLSLSTPCQVRMLWAFKKLPLAASISVHC